MEQYKKTLLNILVSSKQLIGEYKKKQNFDNLTKEQIIDQYLTTRVTLPTNASIKDWSLIELISNEKDILVVANEYELNALCSVFKQTYSDIPTDKIKSITERIYVAGKDINNVYEGNGYKVIVIDYTNTVFKVKISKWIAKYFPDTDLVLGLN